MSRRIKISQMTVLDLLEEDYFYSQRLKIQTKNASDLLWVTEGELSSKGATASISASRKGSTLSLDKFRVKSDGRVLIEASLITSKASKFTMKAEDGRQEPGKPLQSFGKLGCEFKMPSTYATADIDVVNGPIFKSSIVYNFSPSISFGGGTVVNTHLEEKNQSPELTDFSMAASYKGPDWNLTGKTLDSFGLLRLSYLHSVSPKLTVGSQLDYRIKGNSQKLSVGAKYLYVTLSLCIR
jgi:Eukaryotic porin